jgi:hypothetical protein
MGGPPRTLRAVESIGNIVDLLRSCHHNGFPVVHLRADDCPHPAPGPSSSYSNPHASLPVDFEGPLAADQGGAGSGRNVDGEMDDVAWDGKPVQGPRPVHVGKGRLEGIILRSHLRHILGARFMRDGGTPNSLWKRVTSPPSVWPSGAGGAGSGGRAEGGRGVGGDVPLVGDPEMYELIEYRRRRIEVATVKEWEWGMFCEEDRSRLVNLASYMNAACYSVHEGCTVARAYSLFRSVIRVLCPAGVGRPAPGPLRKARVWARRRERARECRWAVGKWRWERWGARARERAGVGVVAAWKTLFRRAHRKLNPNPKPCQMGLRHLPVVDVSGAPVGMLTRANFSERTMHRMVQKYYNEGLLFFGSDHQVRALAIFGSGGE